MLPMSVFEPVVPPRTQEASSSTPFRGRSRWFKNPFSRSRMHLSTNPSSRSSASQHPNRGRYNISAPMTLQEQTSRSSSLVNIPVGSAIPKGVQQDPQGWNIRTSSLPLTPLRRITDLSNVTRDVAFTEVEHCFRCDIFTGDSVDMIAAEAECKQLLVEAGAEIVRGMSYPGGFLYKLPRGIVDPLEDGEETEMGGFIAITECTASQLAPHPEQSDSTPVPPLVVTPPERAFANEGYVEQFNPVNPSVQVGKASSMRPNQGWPRRVGTLQKKRTQEWLRLQAASALTVAEGREQKLDNLLKEGKMSKSGKKTVRSSLSNNGNHMDLAGDQA